MARKKPCWSHLWAKNAEKDEKTGVKLTLRFQDGYTTSLKDAGYFAIKHISDLSELPTNHLGNALGSHPDLSPETIYIEEYGAIDFSDPDGNFAAIDHADDHDRFEIFGDPILALSSSSSSTLTQATQGNFGAFRRTIMGKHLWQDSVARENDNHQQVDKPFHPPKHFVFPKKKCGSRERSCQHAWFETYDWLHYDESTQSVFCHYCMVQERKGNLKDQGSKEDAYITKGFSSWKKAPKCFQAHQDSACHKTAQTYQLTIPKCLDVEEMIDNQLTEKRTVERKYLLQVIRCLRYLARQGIALQGDDGNDNFTQLLHLVGISDENLMKHLDGKIGSKYTHSDVQNELLNIMATLTLLEKLKDIDERRFFSMIADEGTDISNKEQLSFCLRTVDENLEAYEDFIGFHQLENIKSDVIVRVIKDILLRLNLSLENCRGQTYDGASNMMGRKSGVSTQILAEQPKAVAIHCEGHSLSLSIKSLTSECDTLKDTLSVVKEICVLVKYSPKRENLLGNIHESIEKSGEDFEPMKKLTKLSTTRWTVRAECMKRIIDNYESLLLLWDECLKEKLDQETKARIIGCKSQMRSFNFYFGLTLSHTLYNMTDNLSRSLQGEKMSALS
ncbi:zinc finger MYM-type protein 1-like [Clytia hemisphaerica]|uniref:zinc finger MYM-type protein 1-like n=1 Tax=Clytia hemisphaerica TaxID=252671 RepID=UPI0034D5BE88